MRHFAGFPLFVWAALSLSASPGLAMERTVTLDPAATEISFELQATGHDVAGAFQLVAGELSFDPGTHAASGEIRIDATGADTGNKKRDKTMHHEVLESERYPLFVFRPDRLEGSLPESGTSELKLHGTVVMHGADHPLTLSATVTVEGTHVSAVTSFSVPYVEWGMKDPSWLFLRVAKEVEVTVNTEGELASR
jgi:polyisoprenoid-binding protein YceI